MKKIILSSVLFFALTGLTYAQSLAFRINQLSMNSLSAAPTVPDVTAKADAKLNIFSADLVGSFSLASGNMLRVGVGYSSLKLSGKTNAVYSDNEFDKGTANLSQSNIRITPGISTRLSGADKFDFYAGIDLPISIIGSTTFESEMESQYRDFNDSMVHETFRTEGKADGGFAMGLSPFLGFSYHGLGPFSIGTEVASGLQYTAIGPDSEIKFYQDGVFQDEATSDINISSFSKMPVRVSLVIAYRLSKASEK